jgi:hypothetical protein
MHMRLTTLSGSSIPQAISFVIQIDPASPLRILTPTHLRFVTIVSQPLSLAPVMEAVITGVETTEAGIRVEMTTKMMGRPLARVVSTTIFQGKAGRPPTTVMSIMNVFQ